MIKVENIDTWGFEHAIRGMRNPLNSWGKSDSDYGRGNLECWKCESLGDVQCNNIYQEYIIGDADMTLMQKLFKGGSEHRKYLRQIIVSMDIVAPLYWWKEFDTYKVGTVANSCSTMHKIHAKEFTLDDFSHEHLDEYFLNLLKNIIIYLNDIRDIYVNYEDLMQIHDGGLKLSKKSVWWQMIQLLPSSYNQRRTVTMNYENVVNMIHQRENHKLDEWREFVNQLKRLPYVKQIMGGE